MLTKSADRSRGRDWLLLAAGVAILASESRAQQADDHAAEARRAAHIDVENDTSREEGTPATQPLARGNRGQIGDPKRAPLTIASLRAGSRIRVTFRDGGAASTIIVGKFLAADQVSIQIEPEDDSRVSLTIPKARVTRLEARGKSRRRGALIGAAAGFAIGLWPRGVCYQAKSYAGAAACAVVPFAALGAAIAALVTPSRGWEVVTLEGAASSTAIRPSDSGS
jgi:hypothetical protein